MPALSHFWPSVIEFSVSGPLPGRSEHAGPAPHKFKYQDPITSLHVQRATHARDAPVDAASARLLACSCECIASSLIASTGGMAAMGTEQSGMLGSVALASTGSLLAPAPTAAAPRPNACPRFELTTCVCNVCVCVCSLSREHRCSTTSGYRQRATVQIEQRIGCLPLCCEACYKSLRVCPRPAMVRLENVQRREGQHRG